MLCCLTKTWILPSESRNFAEGGKKGGGGGGAVSLREVQERYKKPSVNGARPRRKPKGKNNNRS